jgi:hypothetical protein
MRRLLLALAATTLLAQPHYEGSVFVRRVAVPVETRLGRDSVPTLEFSGPGRSTQRLELPPELDGRLGRCELITHHRGTTWALGRLHPYLPHHPALRKLAMGAANQGPLHLYSCRDGQSWQQIGVLSREAGSQISALVPLGDGSFLLKAAAFFWKGDEVGPFGIFRLDATGKLSLEGLADLGLGGPLYRAVPFPPGTEAAKKYGRGPQVVEAHRELDGGYRRWFMRRLPAGILLVHGASGRWFLLDEQDAHGIHQGRLWAPGEAEVAFLAARPDGQALVAAFQGSRQAALQAWTRQGMRSYAALNTFPTHPGDALLVSRGVALDDQRFRQRPDLRWLVLDPRAPAPWELAPPKDFPPPLDTMDMWSFSATVRPDGNLVLERDPSLDWFREVPDRRWLQRLLQPFRLPYRPS